LAWDAGMRLWIGLAAVLALTAVSSVATAKEVLPADVVPSRYDLHLRPNAQSLTFSGDLGVMVQVKTPVRDVTLNAADLVFDQATADGGSRAAVTLDAKTGQATLHFARALPVGAHRLQIAYHGKIGRATLGFFAMDYSTSRGPRRTLATNFEPASARRLLPCWDQPDRKAVFAITVDAPADRMAVSNMPVATRVPLPDGMQRVSFAPTPRMSTYLLYLGIGDWERIHTAIDGTDVGVVVNKGDAEKGRYALDQAARLLHWYNGYFGTPFPLPKLDLIAAPGEIDGGSMENWGAIFYSQQHLLFEPKAGTEADRQLVFLVVAHEMAHQWFGDLVTMRWWDNLWLNEGFARWMQTYAADALHPEWRTGLQAQSIFESGKRADAEVSTHPVLQPIDTVDQASQAFDNITYDKGAAVITMISADVGDARFREGVQRYMKAHAYGNTVDTDLWSIMQQVAGKPILKIEADFTRQAGLPLVRVAPAPGALSLTEDRFYADGSARPTGQHWALPLSIAPASGPAHSLLLESQTSVAADAGALVNAGQTGYARVLYAPADFDALQRRLGRLASVDQLGLINDSVALGLAGYAPASRSLSAIAALPPEADPIVWSRAVALLLQLDSHYPAEGARDRFRRFAREVLAPVAARIGRAPQPGEDAGVALLRGRIMEAQGDFGDQDVIAWAKAHWDDPSAPAAERRVALRIYAGAADRGGFDALLARAAQTKNPLEQVRIYEALSKTSDAVSAAKLIDVALSGSMPTGANLSVIIGLADNEPDLVWKTAVPRLGEPQAGITANYQWLSVGDIASLSADPARATELEAYVQKTVPESARKPFTGDEATIHRNARIAAEVLPELDRWIASRRPD
jgi:aminopeptidase N